MSTVGAATRISNPGPEVTGSLMKTKEFDVIETLPADEVTAGPIVTPPALVRSMLPPASIVPPPKVTSDDGALMPTVVFALIKPPTVTVDPLIVTPPPVDAIRSFVVTAPGVVTEMLPLACSGEPGSWDTPPGPAVTLIVPP